MRIDIATLFPELCERVMSESIIGRARKNRQIDINCHQIRDYTLDKQKKVDDYPYGGGKGMVMQADPIFRCFENVVKKLEKKPYVIYVSPKGNLFNQQKPI
ncbi:MAG: tRNA (guanosine(37)-N1)-methyltransferase TrmD, partial [Oscillospiraceae bacterium]